MEFIGQLWIGFIGWFWVLATIFFATLFMAKGVKSLNKFGKVMAGLIGTMLLLTVLAYGEYFHVSSFYLVKDLRNQMINTVENTDSFGNGPSVNYEQLVAERNKRLSALGRCTDGAWWVTKYSGESPEWVDTAVYYYCGRYGY